METINITKKRFESLECYDLPNYVFNTEGTLYVLPIKSRWDTKMKLLKRLYLTNGKVFGNKLQTINSLIDNKEELDIEEIVFPEKIATVSGEIVGFTMPLIESINLSTALRSREISNERKIKYLKQIGLILEKMQLRRDYTSIKEFYINDLHESNFIVDNNDNVKVIDIDSCKINGNDIFNSKYLSSKSFINEIYKYQKNNNCNLSDNEYHKYSTDITGAYIPDENTDLYCYMIVILNFLYEDNVARFNLQEFYDYLDYLDNIGIDKELLTYFENIVTGSQNENPYPLLDSLTNYIGRSNYHVYSYIKKKK